jgi:hypothetical protein
MRLSLQIDDLDLPKTFNELRKVLKIRDCTTGLAI